MPEYIVIPNWERFQHYRDRSPVWIKLYTELNSSDEWLGLSAAARGLLVTIWIEYARSHGALLASKAMSLCNKSARRSHLEELNHAGLIRLAASPETEKRRDKRAEDPKTTAHFTIPDILEDIAPDDVTRFASKLRDHDRGTEHVLRKLRREAPFAVFADAYGALEARRKKSPALTSEVRYYVATVQKLTGDWKQETYL